MRADRAWLGLFGLGLAAGLVFALRGFTVDDALISARYAWNLHRELGHQFNATGPVTDGVTPLAWPYLLAPFAGGGPLDALHAATWLGSLAWIVAAAFLASHIGSIVEGRTWKRAVALLVAFGTPGVSAWAASGMETGLALSLCTCGAILGDKSGRRTVGSLLCGTAAAFRPELVPYALTLALGCAFTSTREATERAKQVLKHVGVALAPFVMISLARFVMFDSVAPLSVRAKPSDLQHGLTYAVAACLVAGPPLAVLAPFAWRRQSSWARWLLAGFVVHACVCVAVGGDWMPMSRLFVPVLPTLAIVFAHLSNAASTWSTVLRCALCVAGQLFVFATVGPAATRVRDDRMRLIEGLARRVQERDVVASLDIGWVGAAHQGMVTDLAGVTDPHIAGLPGGHTSKRIPPGLFDARDVSHVVLLLPQNSGISANAAWERCDFARAVEVRTCRMPAVRKVFQVADVIESTPRLRYALLRRK